MNSCVLVVVHLDKDGEQAQRVPRNMDVDLIQKVFTITIFFKSSADHQSESSATSRGMKEVSPSQPDWCAQTQTSCK